MTAENQGKLRSADAASLRTMRLALHASSAGSSAKMLGPAANAATERKHEAGNRVHNGGDHEHSACNEERRYGCAHDLARRPVHRTRHHAYKSNPFAAPAAMATTAPDPFAAHSEQNGGGRHDACCRNGRASAEGKVRAKLQHHDQRNGEHARNRSDKVEFVCGGDWPTDRGSL